jgi:hypothetical protein
MYLQMVLKVLNYDDFSVIIGVVDLTNVNFDTKISCYRSNSLFRICDDMI